MITLKPELVVKVRLQVLYDVVRELVQAFSVDYPEHTANLIRQGVLEKQYFKAIYIYFLNEEGKRVGEAVIEIDWKLHTVKVKEGKNSFRVDQSKSVHEQISEVFPVLVKHVEKMKRVLKVTKTVVWYGWRGDLQNLHAAKTELGFSTGKSPSPPEWASSVVIKPEPGDDDLHLEYVSQALQELRVTIKHKLK
jgi:hypothetical protein